MKFLKLEGFHCHGRKQRLYTTLVILALALPLEAGSFLILYNNYSTGCSYPMKNQKINWMSYYL